jgi:hypothetical protein
MVAEPTGNHQYVEADVDEDDDDND